MGDSLKKFLDTTKGCLRCSRALKGHQDCVVRVLVGAGEVLGWEGDGRLQDHRGGGGQGL